jgi:hypothetical protein
MALLKPLVFDGARGVNRQLETGDTLHLAGSVLFAGPVGFNGVTPALPQVVGGNWGQSLDRLIRGLAVLGLVQDGRPTSWMDGVNATALLGAVGPYEPGRLIVGSTGGWMPLDQPAAVPGVIQVPTSHAGLPETSPVTGLAMRTLAYSPILAYGAVAPVTTPLAGALWMDTTAGELKVFTGTVWASVLGGGVAALLQTLTAAGNGAVLVADGGGGVRSIAPPAGATGGRVLAYGGSGVGAFIDLVSMGLQPPWPAGVSATDPIPTGGGRPPGATEAIWCNPAGGAETIGFWDEAALQWKTAYVNNPVLNRLAELRTALAPGDLITFKGGQVDRLSLGSQGTSLVVDAGELKWHDRFSTAATAPSTALDGDLWLDSSTSRVSVRQGGRWLAINDVQRFAGINGSGQSIRAGQPLVHGAANWQLAGPSTAMGSAVAIALEDALPGGQVAAGIEGVITLREAQWAGVIDNAEPHALVAGLTAGRDYYVSSTAAGQLTTKPAGSSGVAVGTALSSTQLLLRSGLLRDAALPARAHVGATPPPARPGELWWNTVTGELMVLFDDGTSTQWVSASPDNLRGSTTTPGGGTGGGGVGGLCVTALEAIDFVSDPLTAAIRVTHSDGTDTTLRIRGAGGTVVTMADNQTLVIDAGGSRVPPSNAATGGGATGGGATPAGAFLLPGPGVLVNTTNQIIGLDEGSF